MPRISALAKGIRSPRGLLALLHGLAHRRPRLFTLATTAAGFVIGRALGAIPAGGHRAILSVAAEY